jgi:hypothetical protein
MGGLARRGAKHHTPSPDNFDKWAGASSGADYRITNIWDTCHESGVRDAHGSGHKGGTVMKKPHTQEYVGDIPNMYETKEKYTTVDQDHIWGMGGEVLMGGCLDGWVGGAKKVDSTAECL